MASISGIDFIKKQITDLEKDCESLNAAIISKKEQNVNHIATEHERLRNIYQKVHAELDQQIQSFAYAQYSAEIPADFFTLQELNTYLEEKTWSVFQNNILTLYPHAPINYGRALVGSKTDWKPAEKTKLGKLCEKYPQLREIRGDGNCFYSSFATGYLTWLCQDSKRFETAIGELFEIGEFPGSTETFQVFFDLKEDPSRLEIYTTNNQKMLPFVSYLRHRAAHHMVTHKEDFFHDGNVLIEQGKDFLFKPSADYLQDCVLRMGHDADNLEIGALCSSLNFPSEIYDNRASGLARTPFLEHAGDPRMGIFRNGAHYSFLQRNPTELPKLPPVERKSSSSPSSSLFNLLGPAAAKPSVVSRPSEMRCILTIKYDCGFGHSLYIRGSGANLTWEKGIQLRNIGPDAWVYETDKDFDALEFKVLVDDSRWEGGDNHRIPRSQTLEYRPSF